MKKLILIVLIMGCVTVSIYYTKIKRENATVTSTQSLESDRAKIASQQQENDKKGAMNTTDKLKIAKLKIAIKHGKFSRHSLYKLMSKEYTKEEATSVAKEFVHDENLGVSLAAVEILLKLNYNGDLEKIVMELVVKDRESYYRETLLSLANQYRLGNTDEIVKYLIDNKLYTSRDNLGNIIKKASKEKQIEYLHSEVGNTLHPVHRKTLLLELGVTDDENSYRELLGKKNKADHDIIEDGSVLLKINELYPDIVPDSTVERLFKIVETSKEGNGDLTDFIRNYASSRDASQERLESILLNNNDKSISENVLVNLIMLFPESKVAKNYLVDELNKVTNITSPQLKYRLAVLANDPYINEMAPAPKSEYETPNTSVHWEYRVRQKDRSPYIWIHNYVKGYTLPN